MSVLVSPPTIEIEAGAAVQHSSLLTVTGFESWTHSDSAIMVLASTPAAGAGLNSPSMVVDQKVYLQ